MVLTRLNAIAIHPTRAVLTANIESGESRRREKTSAGLLPEHPRASSSDDVEYCLHDKILHLKMFKSAFAKYAWSSQNV